MYEKFFGFRERPFEVVPDPRYLFLGGSHREALTSLKYGITGGTSLTMLTGEVGTGKTMLLRAALAAGAEAGIRCVHLNTPTIDPAEFTRFLARNFGLSPEAAHSSSLCHEELTKKLINSLELGERWSLVIDEAQSLSDETLEEIRFLTNLETQTAKLLPVVLVGQPELSERFQAPSLRNLRQRVALRCTLQALDLNETASYIATRIKVAGGRSVDVLTREAVFAIYRASQGLPRAITVLCDNVLITGFAAGQRPVRSRIVNEVCQDFEVPQTSDQELAAVAEEETVADVAEEAPATASAPVTTGSEQDGETASPALSSSDSLMFNEFNKPARTSFFRPRQS